MKIKNWSKFQHFKDRKPPWVKLYRDLLDNIEWHLLDPKAAKVLTMLWLIASEDDGNLPEIKTLAFRLRLSEKETNDSIFKLSHWLIQDDINVISNRYQSDILETEKETEKETETKIDKEKEKEKKPKSTRLSSTFILPDEWIEFCKIERPDLNPIEIFNTFKDYWIAKPSNASRADWFATWRNWIRRQDEKRNSKTETLWQKKQREDQERMDEFLGKSSKIIEVNAIEIVEGKIL